MAPAARGGAGHRRRLDREPNMTFAHAAIAAASLPGGGGKAIILPAQSLPRNRSKRPSFAAAALHVWTDTNNG